MRPDQPDTTPPPATTKPPTPAPDPTPPAPTGAAGPPRSWADLLVATGGVLIVAFSFAPFVGYDRAFISQVPDAGLAHTWSAWSAQTFMAPLTWFVVAAGAILAGLVLLRRTGHTRDLVGFRPAQLQVGLSLFALAVLVGYAASRKHLTFGADGIEEALSGLGVSTSPHFAWGGMVMLAGALLASAGALINHLGAARPDQNPPA